MNTGFKSSSQSFRKKEEMNQMSKRLLLRQLADSYNVYWIFLLINFIAFLNTLNAANDNIAIDGRAAGLGNASVTLSDIWSVNHNQAGLAYIKNNSAGICYENNYLLTQLSQKAIAMALPIKGGVFGLSICRFGYQLYSESKYGIAFSKMLGEKISAGVQLDYFNTRIAEGYGSKGVPIVELGLQAKLTNNLIIGTHLFNPTRSKIADYYNERIPTIMQLGFNFRFSEKVFTVAEIEKDILNKPNLKFGIEYHPKKELYLRTGFSTKHPSNSFGFGLQLKQMKIDFAFSYSYLLGFTPHAGLIYTME